VATNNTFYIKQYDTLEPIREVLKGSDGVPIPNLAAAQSIHFHLRNRTSGKVAVNSPATVLDNATSTVQYEWVAGDTDVAGAFTREWHISWGPGIEQRVPNGASPDLVQITQAAARP
jgi:hypothetical protein